jgi:hypothetical protein
MSPLVKGVEPTIVGMSANRELQLVHPEVQMRSDLVFDAMGSVPNRYFLTKLASKAVRGMHKPGGRIADTTNDVLARFSHAYSIAGDQPLQEPLEVLMGHKTSLTDPPRQSKVVSIGPAREISNPLWEEPRALRA